MSRLLLSGFYGMGNAGDEAILAALVQLFREREPGIEIAVLSGSPPTTAREHGVIAVPRMAPGAARAAMRRCDLFISGGGSLLQDVTSAQSLLYYLGLLMLARALRRPAVVLAQGIGPIRRPALRRLTGRVLSGVERITVRDADSAAELRRLGVGESGRPSIEVTADPVFALSPAAPERGRELVCGAEPGSRPWVGVSLRPWPGVEAMIPPLAAALRAVTERGGTPVLLPLQPGEDTPVSRRLAESLGGAVLLADVPASAEWLALVGQLDLVVAMRLHALIFAAAAGVPCLGIRYDPKVESLLARLQLAPAGRVEALDVPSLQRRVACAVDSPEAERAPAAVIAGIRDAARRNAQIALEVIGTRRSALGAR
jgi:polysaccharide pyruvyl transferase CsaB